MHPKMGSVAANTAWLYADQVVRMALGLITFGFVTRHLGPGNFGLLSYAIAFPAILLPLATLGINHLVVRELVRRPGEQRRIMCATVWLLLAASVFSFAVAAAGTALLPADDPARRLISITIWVLLTQPFQVIDYFFQSRVNSRYTVMARLGTNLTANLARIGLVIMEAAVGWFAWVFVGEALLLGLALVLAYRQGGGIGFHLWKDWVWAEARGLLRAAWPLLLAGLAIALTMRLDHLLVGWLAGLEQLGVYAAAARLAEALYFLPLAMINSYFPRFVAARDEGPAAFARAQERFFQAITWTAVAIAAGVTVLAPWITKGIMGSGYTGSAPVLILFVWANVFGALIAVRGKWFLAENLQHYTLVFYTGGAVLHLTGICWLVPRLGLVGAGISYLGAQVFMALVAPLLFARTRSASLAACRGFLPPRKKAATS
jgi:O-antigen/teichoic acid export membrane protein